MSEFEQFTGMTPIMGHLFPAKGGGNGPSGRPSEETPKQEPKPLPPGQQDRATAAADKQNGARKG